MAPGTTLGAATPIAVGNPPSPMEEPDEEGNEAEEDKGVATAREDDEVGEAGDEAAPPVAIGVQE
jgi:membrane-bound ClpP family serine protease